ncbi:ribonuclease III domain-containing protein [Lactobacillus helsingborgensis]|uniref:Mini-ribonuclease 3 n=1 Tax=Lactobacillus helsingborgensis TaxID=1218494 RepID=UPI002740FC4A|nr:ribonuclease III domain-containing protein [Lactobacillus helsingborgensis]WLS99965.1 ribonuclease III domain-containing protein [Lactobacillus helsingborgensis]
MNKTDKMIEKEVNPDTLNGQTLAYLGDAVYEIFIRQHLIKCGVVKPQVLQRRATHYVSAKAQAALITKLQEDGLLTEDEVAIFHRGRNSKTYTKAKNTSLATYKLSTGFEAVWGYLELLNEKERIQELTAWCIKNVENGSIEKYDFK